MRILVDEDLASRELLRRLAELDGIEVLGPDRGAADREVWDFAQAEQAAILTGNVVDFLRLADRHQGHHGLLLVYRSNDRTRNLRAVDIAAGVEHIRDAYRASVRALTLAVNDFVER